MDGLLGGRRGGSDQRRLGLHERFLVRLPDVAGTQLLVHRVQPLGSLGGVALGDGEIGEGQHGETAKGLRGVHIVGDDRDVLVGTSFTGFETAESGVEAGAGAEGGNGWSLASEAGETGRFVVSFGGFGELARLLEIVGDIGQSDGGERFAGVATGEGAAGGFVLAGGEFFAEGFAAAFVPEEIGKEGEDADDDADGALDDEVLVALPE